MSLKSLHTFSTLSVPEFDRLVVRGGENFTGIGRKDCTPHKLFSHLHRSIFTNKSLVQDEMSTISDNSNRGICRIGCCMEPKQLFPAFSGVDEKVMVV